MTVLHILACLTALLSFQPIIHTYSTQEILIYNKICNNLFNTDVMQSRVCLYIW